MVASSLALMAAARLSTELLTIGLQSDRVISGGHLPVLQTVDSAMPQAVLGIAFGWGAIMAWAASRATIDVQAWWLFGATICWAVAYDTIYALQDREDDQRIGVKSSALLFGAAVPLAVGLFFTGMTGCLIAAGYVSGLGIGYYVIVAVL